MDNSVKCQCNNCGATIEYGAKFCNNCGIQLNWGEKTEPQDNSNYMQAVFTPSSSKSNSLKNAKKNSKKHSPLGLTAAVMCGVAIVLPLPIIISFILCLCSMIIAIIDLATPSETKHKADDICAIIIGVIYCFVLYR